MLSLRSKRARTRLPDGSEQVAPPAAEGDERFVELFDFQAQPRHCVFTHTDRSVSVEPIGTRCSQRPAPARAGLSRHPARSSVIVNGSLVDGPHELEDGDRVVLGSSCYFLFRNPLRASAQTDKAEQVRRARGCARGRACTNACVRAQYDYSFVHSELVANDVSAIMQSTAIEEEETATEAPAAAGSAAAAQKNLERQLLEQQLTRALGEVRAVQNIASGAPPPPSLSPACCLPAR